jgi:hypothetical protein
MEKVDELVKEIKGTITQKTSSKKDEVRVMRAMLNDDTFKVGVYDKGGQVAEYCPAEAAHDMVATIIESAAKVSSEEAKILAKRYEFGKKEAETMVDISKEFVMNTYLHTGRKIALGGREKSDISLSLKEIEPGTRPFPKVIGIDSDGKKLYGRGVAKVSGYDGVKVYAPCPAWIKREEQ